MEKMEQDNLINNQQATDLQSKIEYGGKRIEELDAMMLKSVMDKKRYEKDISDTEEILKRLEETHEFIRENKDLFGQKNTEFDFEVPFIFI